MRRAMARSRRSLFGHRSTVQGSSLDRAYLALGERLGESLEREMIAGGTLVPRLTPTLALAIAIAALTYAAVIAVAAGGAALIVFGAPNGFMIALGAVLLAAAVVTCPRPFTSGPPLFPGFVSASV